MKDSKCFEFTYLEVLVTYRLFGCGRYKRRDNKTVDGNGHKCLIHSDMFLWPSATILIGIQITTDHKQNNKYQA